jgi:hypothetical protein
MVMKSEHINADSGTSNLRARSIIGLFCVILAVKDLLSWAELTSSASGWLVRVTGADWMEPFAGLVLAVLGVIWAGPSVMQCFGVRDDFRKQARRWALAAGFISAGALVFTLDAAVPSKDMLFFKRGTHLTREARRAALAGTIVAACGLAGFLIVRRRDVGFWKVSLPVYRDNDIWSMNIKAEISLRAVARNDEAYHLLEERAEYLQHEIGGKFDMMCRHLAKESADLATIDSTARLQMDVGHVFKRYADFHVRLAETRHRIAEQIREAAYVTIVDLMENRLPGLKLKAAQDANLSIAYPVLHDAEGLKKRREEWDETMRGVVSIGAAKGNEIIGEWIDRAARGEVTAEEMPAAMEIFRALCGPSGSNGRPLELSASSSSFS